MHLKGLAMVQNKLPSTIFIDQKIASQTSFITTYGNIFYDKELTCQEVVDP